MVDNIHKQKRNQSIIKYMSISFIYQYYQKTFSIAITLYIIQLKELQDIFRILNIILDSFMSKIKTATIFINKLRTISLLYNSNKLLQRLIFQYIVNFNIALKAKSIYVTLF